MKYLAIDYGSHRIGIAVSNAEGTIAFPRTELANDRSLLEEIVRMVASEKIERVVIGDTRALNGGANLVTEEAERFGEALANTISVPVEAVSEAWSTVEAARYAPKGQEHNDAAAAAVLLQRYLDMRSGVTLPDTLE